ncbi:hypothetical protein SEPCBS57363_002977 [Sporothrix epigloea]|uniref:Cyclin N-terminal domain-containing protein n=1 Tax=Sporothrix epigloea TaxID=1892477 RepID=A0ABP0DJ30_9PEZI
MPPKAATVASPPSPLPDVEASALHPIFSPESVKASLEYLSDTDTDNAETAIKAVGSAKYGDANKDAGAFWADLIDAVSLSTSSAVFCEEEEVASELDYRARTALVAAYRTVFRHAGFTVDSYVSTYDLLQTAHSRQLTSQPALEVKRNCALAAVLALSTFNPRLWMSALERLRQAQRRCTSSPLNIDQLTRAIV